ncbi:MAG: M20 family metallopeptidase [Rhodobacteraceae bacterium]|nr:M20 family metallopeptidase [Paracoccaceae bacterium]
MDTSDTRAGAIDRAERYFDSGGFAADLARLVAYPTESQVPARAPELMRYLREALQPRLAAAGFACEIFANPEPKGGPLLLAERIEPQGPRVLSYGHGDVIRAQETQWRAGLRPFDLTDAEGRLYGRGSADNKAQHLINIAALEAVLAERGALGFSMRFVIEMSEETGSPGLDAFCAARAGRLASDVLIASDGPRLQPDTPTVFTGARGAMNFDMTVQLRDGAHHSGNWGGVLADPAMILAQALSTITDARGCILIPEWRPDSLTPAISAALRDLPVVGDAGPEIDPEWGETGLSPAERLYGWNAFAVLAMQSGVPDAPVNAIAGEARATCQLRFVVGTDMKQILPALRRHLARAGFGDTVRVTPHEEKPFCATRLDPRHPWVRFTAGSLERTSGRTPHVLPNLAGSLPNEVFSDILGLPTVWIPHSYRGCSQHAPNEHVLKPVCRDALRCMVGLFADIADTGGPAPAAP